jgi:hypothetical protein
MEQTVTPSMIRRARTLATATALLAGSTGCRHRTAAAAATPPATRAASSHAVAGSTPSPSHTATSFQSPTGDFSTISPSGWTTKRDPQNVLTTAGPSGVELDIAVPKLPAHVPGIIPLPAVQSGYVDDTRKRLKDVNVTETQPIRVAGATARRFAIDGADPTTGTQKKLLVIAIVRGDHLYIITGEGPADRYDLVKDAVEKAAAAWKWTK